MSKDDDLKKIGESAYSAIVDMIAALKCDYDRLKELQEEQRDLQSALEEAEGEEDEEEITRAQEALNLWLEEFKEELDELEEAAQDCESGDDAMDAIMNDALSIEVRSSWESVGEDLTPTEFKILLTTGGPAVQIRGELNERGEPSRAWLEVQDWGTPWTQYFGADQDTLLEYACCFTYGV